MRYPLTICLLLALGVVAFAPSIAAADETADSLWVYFGTYTRRNDSKGIYVYRLDTKTGELTLVDTTSGVENPSFLAIHPTGNYLYCVSEVSDSSGKPAGGVSSFTLDRKTGKLAPINQQVSGGTGPCHLSVDKTGKAIVVAHYGDGSTASLPVRADGSLGEVASRIQHTGSSVDPRRQTGPHAHSANIDTANRFVFVADLGLDKMLVYRLDPETAQITPHDPPYVGTPAGGGPRHFAFHPSGKFAYVNNEMGCSVTAMAYDAERGILKPLQTISTLPADVTDLNGITTAEVAVHPSGKFLYVSNRGHDTIAMFRIIEETGELTALGYEPTGGQVPRNFCIDPSGKWLLAANQQSNDVYVFRVDPETGMLRRTEHSAQIPAPVCIRFVAPAK